MKKESSINTSLKKTSKFVCEECKKNGFHFTSDVGWVSWDWIFEEK